MQHQTSRSRPRTDLIAAAVFLAAVLVAALLGYRAITGFLGLTDDLTRVIVPGASEVTLTDTGSYTIFYEHRSTVDGQVFDTPESLGGLRVSLIDSSNGSVVPLSTPGSDVEYSFGGRSGYAVLGFDIDRAGTYELTGFYEDGSTSPEVVLAIGQGVGRNLVVSILAGFGAVAVFLIGTGAAIALAIIPRVRRNRAASQNFSTPA